MKTRGCSYGIFYHPDSPVIGSQNNITIAALITEVLRAFIEKYAKENQMNYNIAKNKIFKAIRETIDEEDISEGLS